MTRIGFPQQSIPLTRADRITDEWHRYLQDLHKFSGGDTEKFFLYQDAINCAGDVIPDAVDGPILQAVSGGVQTYAFPAPASKVVRFFFALPHGYLPNTMVTPFVQWLPQDATAGSVRWVFEYVWSGIGFDAPPSAILNADSAAPGIAKRHTYADFPVINPRVPNTNPKDKTISSVILGKLSRDATNSADTYGNDALFLAVGVHFANAAHGTVRPWP